MLIRFLNGLDTEKREAHFSRPFVDFFFSLCLSLYSYFSLYCPRSQPLQGFMASALSFSLFPPYFSIPILSLSSLFLCLFFGGKTNFFQSDGHSDEEWRDKSLFRPKLSWFIYFAARNKTEFTELVVSIERTEPCTTQGGSETDK